MAIYWSVNLRSGFALGTASMHLLAASIRDFSAELSGMMNGWFMRSIGEEGGEIILKSEKKDVFDYFDFNSYRTHSYSFNVRGQIDNSHSRNPDSSGI
jgi:hypothetical protein